MNKLLIACLLSFQLVTSIFAEEREFKIGIFAPLTGDYSSAGKHIKQGIELALEDLKSEGLKLKIYFEDACLPADGVKAYKKLTAINQIDAIATNYCVITLNAIRSFIEKDKLPVLQNSVTPAYIFQDSQYIFSTWPTIEDEVAQIVKYMTQTLNVKRAGVMSLQTPWGEGYKDSFQHLFPLSGGEVVGAETTSIGINDFRSEITRLKGKNPEAILLAHTGSPLTELLKQSKRLGLTIPTIVSSDADDETIIRNAGVAAEGMTLFSTQSPIETNEEMQFKTRFRERFKETPTPLSQHAHDELKIIVHALKTCNFDRECTAMKIRKLENYKGVSGEFSIKDTGGAARKFHRKEVMGGQIKFAE